MPKSLRIYQDAYDITIIVAMTEQPIGETATLAEIEEARRRKGKLKLSLTQTQGNKIQFLDY